MPSTSDYLFRAQLYREIVERSPIAIAVFDRQGRLVLANEQMTWLTARSEQELETLMAEDLLPAELRSQHRVHREAFWDNPQRRVMGSDMDLVIQQKTPDGYRSIPVHINLAPLMTDAGQMVITTIQELRALGEHR